MLILQLISILGFAWLLRKPARNIGLPPVIGEMLAGFVLGPTFFGSIAPHIFTIFFSRESIRSICEIGTLIVAMYCFVIGLEFDAQHLQGRCVTMTVTALVSAIVPAMIGFLAAGYLASQLTPAFRISVALCFSVTAFPILLRIVEDSGLSDRPASVLAIGTSAVLELITWASMPIILAFVSAGNAINALPALGWVAGFLVLWLTIIRQGLKWLWRRIPDGGVASYLLLGSVAIISALSTERLGLHAIFGAFVGGFIIPREASFVLAKKIKPYCGFLLPIFLASAGLKTALNFGDDRDMTILFALAILAYGGKALGAALSARLVGKLDWKESATIGHLMCAKGAIGFAVIEICNSAGFLTRQEYSLLAFVILTNTIMAAWGVFGHYQMTIRRDARAKLAFADTH